MTAHYDVSIVIPVFNKWNLTKDCLESIAAANEAVRYEVIVVDNGSSDETVSACEVLGRQLFGGAFRYERSECNLNFAAGCNRGASVATGQYVLFLNNDTIVTPNWLGPLVARMQSDRRLGAIGPLLMHPDRGGLGDRVQHIGVSVSRRKRLFHIFEHWPVSHPVVSMHRELQAITAAAMMLPRRLFEHVGGFHEAYRNGFEDVDLCVQLARTGSTMCCEPKSRVYHLEGQTPGRHDNEEHNSAIIMQRAMPFMRPDAVQLAEASGFAWGLGGCGETVVLTTPEQRREIQTRLASAESARTIYDLLQEYPCWYEGYSAFASCLVDAGREHEALEWLLLRLRLNASQNVLIQLAKIYRRLGRHDAATHTLQCATKIEKNGSDAHV
ncbi:glycosyltransferase [Desulfobaculum sp. SPO524]|uniref:glycosyltransferase family 2 protein n=1 Tax=Desulfobaculum sp. SPO524 TaxID=3378071 RepID=UPI0038526776